MHGMDFVLTEASKVWHDTMRSMHSFILSIPGKHINRVYAIGEIASDRCSHFLRTIVDHHALRLPVVQQCPMHMCELQVYLCYCVCGGKYTPSVASQFASLDFAFAHTSCWPVIGRLNFLLWEDK